MTGLTREQLLTIAKTKFQDAKIQNVEDAAKLAIETTIDLIVENNRVIDRELNAMAENTDKNFNLFYEKMIQLRTRIND
jgi:hypothetical protein